MTSREVRFRVWDVEKQELLSWDQIWYSVVKLPAGSLANQTEEVWFPFISLALKAPTTKYVVDQFTGLKDKTGREIYENDILEFAENESAAKARGPVVWGSYGDGCFEEYVKGVQCWMVGGFHLPLSSIEHGGVQYGRGTETDGELPVIIGNVHQTPELLA